MTGQPQIKQALFETTSQAVGQGVFGAPSMFVDGQVFFGQDRLMWVEKHSVRRSRKVKNKRFDSNQQRN